MRAPANLAEQIRTRPGMYIGGLNDRGLRWTISGIISELLAASAGQMKQVRLSIQGDREARIEFSGAIVGFGAEQCLTNRLMAAVELSDLAVASAVCEQLDFHAVQNLRVEHQSFSRGLPITPLSSDLSSSDPGLNLRLRFDSSLFPAESTLSFLALCGRLQELAIFHPQTTFTLDDQRQGEHRDYRYQMGLLSYLEEIEHYWFNQTRSSPAWGLGGLYHLRQADGSDSAEAVILESPGGPDARVLSFVNHASTKGHGSHVDGLKRGFSDAMKRHNPEQLQRRASFSNDAFGGATVLVAVNLADPEYRGATKDRLHSPRVEEFVYRMAIEQLPEQFRKKPEAC